MAAMNSCDPLVLGLAFLEVEPQNYECLYDPGTPENPTDEPQWQTCSKEEICSKQIGKDHYRPDKNDPEYIDNWVEKYDLMCQPKTRMGLFGLWFFVGVITTIMLTPWISDIYGR